MKKGMYIAILLILYLATNIKAMGVTLGEPGGTKNTSSIDFKCTATTFEGEEQATLTLWTNINGTFEAGETSPGVVTSGSEYTFTINNITNGNYEWNCEAKNSTANVLAEPNKNFLVQVNHEPIYTIIPSQTWPKNETKTITLSTYFTDPDGDTLTYTADTNPNVGVSITGTIATLTPSNWYGETNITFTADDGKGGTNSTTVDINVTNANRAPYNKIEFMDNVSIIQTEERGIALDEYFGDYDGDSLTYSFRFVSGITHYLNITIDNSSAEATIEPDQTWKGIDYVVFTAYDPQGASLDSNIVTIIVREGTKINRKPNAGSRSPLFNPTLAVGDSQRFSIITSDLDLDDLTIKWYVNSEEQTAYLNKENYTFLALSEGTYAISVTVSDGELSDTQNWTVEVKSSFNSAPNQEIPETTPEEGTNSTNTDLCGNKNINPGETCTTCPQDVPCPPGYECKGERCTKEIKTSNLKLVIIVGVGFMVFTTAVLIGYKIYKKRTLFGGWQPKHNDISEQPVQLIQPTQETKIADQENIPKHNPKNGRVNELLLKHYIQTKLKRGDTIEQIKERLKKEGWQEEKIDDIYKTIALDELYK